MTPSAEQAHQLQQFDDPKAGPPGTDGDDRIHRRLAGPSQRKCFQAALGILAVDPLLTPGVAAIQEFNFLVKERMKRMGDSENLHRTVG